MLAASLAAAATQAQSAWVNGLVLDDETGTPLPGAHVFVAGTLVGDAADDDGRFSLAVEAPSTVELTATMLGHGTAQTTRLLRPGDALSLVFRLPPVSRGLREIRVVTDRDREWERALEVLRPAFLGATPNAAEVEMVNPEVLDLRLDEDGGVEAVAQAPLVVRNGALGYELTFYDLHFAASAQGRSLRGAVAFRDLCAEGACGPDVDEARARAYRGSFPHFLDALSRGRLEQEGFRAARVEGPGRGNVTLGTFLRGRRSADRREASVRAVPSGWEVGTAGALRVAYDREDDERKPWGGLQVSWLTATDDTLRLGPDGALREPTSVVRYGYWGWKRVADLMPRDYRPPPRPDD